MFGTKTRSQPSPYSALQFHVVRTSVFLSALIVTGILSYFCYHLKHDSYKIPWTFFVLLGASSLTVVALCLTFVFYICRSLGPIFSLIVNMALLILWSLGLGLLGWNMSGTLGHVCNKDNWGSWMGIMVCRLYKALFSFTVIGWVSLVALVILDFRARSKQKKQGLYNQMGAPVGGKGTRLGALGLGGFSRNVETKGVQDQAAEPLRVPEGGYDGHTYDNGSHVKVDQFGGYQPPADQTRYDSGGYDAVARH